MKMNFEKQLSDTEKDFNSVMGELTHVLPTDEAVYTALLGLVKRYKEDKDIVFLTTGLVHFIRCTTAPYIKKQIADYLYLDNAILNDIEEE